MRAQVLVSYQEMRACWHPACFLGSGLDVKHLVFVQITRSLSPSITQSNFLLSSGRESICLVAGTQLMITDTNLPGHSCREEQELHRQIQYRTIPLAGYGKKQNSGMFKRRIGRLAVRGAKNGVCTSRKKHRCRTKKWRNQKVSTVPMTKF